MCFVLVCHPFDYSSSLYITRRSTSDLWIDLVCSYSLHLSLLLLLSSVFSKAARSRREAAGDDKWKQNKDKGLQHHFGSPGMFFGKLSTNINYSKLTESHL